MTIDPDAPWWINVPLIIWLAVIVGGGGLITGLVAWAKLRTDNAKSRAEIVRLEAESIKTKAEASKAEAEAERLTDELRRAVLEDAEKLIEGLRRKVDSLTGRIATIERELQATAEREHRAVSHLTEVHDWIDSGCEPPPPSRPSWLPLRPTRID